MGAVAALRPSLEAKERKRQFVPNLLWNSEVFYRRRAKRSPEKRESPSQEIISLGLAMKTILRTTWRLHLISMSRTPELSEVQKQVGTARGRLRPPFSEKAEQEGRTMFGFKRRATSTESAEVIAYKKQVLAAIQEDRNRQEREATPRPRDVGWAIFGLFVIISATTTALSLLTGLGLANEC
jgi:hypothetical protein